MRAECRFHVPWEKEGQECRTPPGVSRAGLDATDPRIKSGRGWLRDRRSPPVPPASKTHDRSGGAGPEPAPPPPGRSTSAGSPAVVRQNAVSPRVHPRDGPATSARQTSSERD
jgi:hypothetical protein